MAKKKEPRSSEEIKNDFRIYKKTRDRDLRDRLVEEHLYMAEILSKKYLNKGIEYEDLYQVASYALVLAVDRYDVTKGFEFSSYATPTIVGEIKKHFRDKGWVIRVPRRIQELSRKIREANSTLNQELQRPPTIEELARFLEVSEEDVLEAMEGSQVYSTYSLDASFDSNDDDSESSLQDFLGEEDNSYERIDDISYLETLMEDLSDIERKIIEDRYLNNKTQVSISEELGVSQMTVSRLEKKTLEKLRQKAL